MDVGVSDLRAHLGDWLDRVRSGEDVVITERGVPVARLVALDSVGMIERLTREGVIGRPVRSSRPRAIDRRRVRARGPVADLIGEQRR